jgi:hypothetical protein
VVIETASYVLKIVGEPHWEMSPEEEKLIEVEIMGVVFVEIIDIAKEADDIIAELRAGLKDGCQDQRAYSVASVLLRCLLNTDGRPLGSCRVVDREGEQRSLAPS